MEYSLLPLYDPTLPLESFMGPRQATTFRRVIRDATEAAWAAYQTCTTSSNCTDGYCTPVVDESSASVTYQCQHPSTVDATAPAPLDVAAMAQEVPQRVPLVQSSMPLPPSILMLQVRPHAGRQTGRQARSCGCCSCGG